MSIEVRNLSKMYGSQKALDDVSFSIGKGEIVGLLGPNGAGKSTLMKILTCYIVPSAGEAFVCGLNTGTSPLEIKKRIGYLPENNPLYIEMYVKEFLEFIANIHHLGKKKKDRIAEIIELTGLGREQHKLIGQLSKGYKQRLGLAQALIHDPEVLILDEPTSGLDPNQIQEIRDLITTVGKSKTVLLSTHIMQEVEAICQRSIIIHLGKIVADDQTARLASGLETEVFTIEFMEEIDQDALLSIGNVDKIVQLTPKSWLLETQPGLDIRPQLSQFANTHHLTLLTLQKATRKIEDVFKELTRKQD